MERCKIVIGNWKMHKTAKEAVSYIQTFAPLVSSASASVYLALSFVALSSAIEAAKETNVIIGAQNMHSEIEGAFTGEISALMLKSLGVDFVILGHSERRTLFHETDAFIHKKLVTALQEDLEPILCIGENAKEHEEGKTVEVLERELLAAVSGIAKEEIAKLVIAYEPIWAIGTGKSATPKKIQEAHQKIRSILQHKYDAKTAGAIEILYGGSVKVDNCKEIVSQKDVDGVLVGAASLDPVIFAQIVNHC